MRTQRLLLKHENKEEGGLTALLHFIRLLYWSSWRHRSGTRLNTKSENLLLSNGFLLLIFNRLLQRDWVQKGSKYWRFVMIEPPYLTVSRVHVLQHQVDAVFARLGRTFELIVDKLETFFPAAEKDESLEINKKKRQKFCYIWNKTTGIWYEWSRSVPCSAEAEPPPCSSGWRGSVQQKNSKPAEEFPSDQSIELRSAWRWRTGMPSSTSAD